MVLTAHAGVTLHQRVEQKMVAINKHSRLQGLNNYSLTLIFCYLCQCNSKNYFYKKIVSTKCNIDYCSIGIVLY